MKKTQIATTQNASSSVTKNSSWSKQASNSLTSNKYLRTAGQRAKYNTLNKKAKKYENSVAKMLKNGFNSPYQSQLKGIANKLNNNNFTYDLNADELYKQYKEQYEAMGNRAMQEAQAEATTLTGGFANSNAATVGSEAYNSYIQQLQSLVPQLYQQARSEHDADTANLYNMANLYSGLNDQAFNKWTQSVQNAMTNRDYYNNKATNYYNSTQYQKSSSKSSQSSGGSSKSSSSSTSTTKKKK